ncbi:MAG: VOC family protein [Chloroflexi bacterium]|nr:VOC family protein [Chloroflexota bacterium]
MSETTQKTAEQASAMDAFKRCIQVGCVVRDLDRKIENLTKIFGIGPFRVVEWPPEGRTDIEKGYHGQPGQFSCRLAFADLGSVELELIEPLAGPSIWQDFLDQHGEGIHHIRFNTFDEKPILDHLSEHGIEVEQWGSGTRPGTAFFYLDSQAQVGFALELLRAIPGTDGRAAPIGKVIETKG